LAAIIIIIIISLLCFNPPPPAPTPFVLVWAHICCTIGKDQPQRNAIASVFFQYNLPNPKTNPICGPLEQKTL
jgi:hypothetical protein